MAKVSSRGPVPKRSDAKAGHRSAAELEVTKAPSGAVINAPTPMPKPNPKWHILATAWYRSLEKSGQTYFYEPSDWMAAVVLAEQLSREMLPKPILITNADGSTELEWVEQAMNGASLNALLKGWTDLLVTEVARRRAAIELQKGPSADEAVPAPLMTLLEKLG